MGRANELSDALSGGAQTLAYELLSTPRACSGCGFSENKNDGQRNFPKIICLALATP